MSPKTRQQRQFYFQFSFILFSFVFEFINFFFLLLVAAFKFGNVGRYCAQISNGRSISHFVDINVVDVADAVVFIEY